MPAADSAQRLRALDPATSFIVQAPAGSGKTELLIQRYLTLLARVNEPESILAITFTKKAAGEMRARVLKALESALQPQPEEEHKRHTWMLAVAASERDRGRRWNVRENPHRLQIRTIDSFCASLVSRMPWLSRFGAAAEPAEVAAPIYTEAARRTVAELESDGPGEAVAALLKHLDNNVGYLQTLLAAMLGNRDQWVGMIGSGDHSPEQRRQVRSDLERILRESVCDYMELIRAKVPEEWAGEIVELAAIAGANIDPGKEIAACAGMSTIPEAVPEALPVWRGLASLLLTKDDKWRKRNGVNKDIGFPPGMPGKERMQALVEALQENDAFRDALIQVRCLPSAEYSDVQWEMLEALFGLLPRAVAHLHQVFEKNQQVDFAAVSLGAARALGDEDEPTDLALILDSRIEHILVDEFQDTSVSQVRLLERLTAGWTPGDGRTLFVVGDPMQSIYRFRAAEVGNFLQAQKDGIGGVELEPLRLSVNFRSRSGVIKWVNEAFSAAFPDRADVLTGAVRFSPSVASDSAAPGECVFTHPFLTKDSAEEEAEKIAGIISQARVADPDTSIAILVRARTHLPVILAKLRDRRLPYRAVDLDPLNEVTIVQDLLALTRALLMPADRIAWLAVLRAPWCGLTLSDLHALVAGEKHRAVRDLLRNEERIVLLSADGQVRAKRLRTVMENVLNHRPSSLSSWVEGAWLALGGPACARDKADLESAEAFFELLEGIDLGGDADVDAWNDALNQLYAAPDPDAGDRLQVMTIHKAKGLEFDVTILPGLGRGAGRDGTRLLRWLRLPAASGKERLLLSPIRPTGEETDGLNEFLSDIENKRSFNESIRLLYVAATRAKQQLHLLGHVDCVKNGEPGELKRPSSGTLLHHLWPVVEPAFAAALENFVAPAEKAVSEPKNLLRRLPANWALPELPPSVNWRPEKELTEDTRYQPSFDWVTSTHRHVGTVVHRLLQQVASDGVDRWSGAALAERRPLVSSALRSLGVPVAELEEAAGRVLRSLENTLSHERGRWILHTHAEAQSEYDVTFVRDGDVVRSKIDRCFVDENGDRWIIDFKTAAHEGGDVEAFLDNEVKRYREQLENYRALLARVDGRRVRAALYFPLLQAWRELPLQARPPATAG